MSKDKKLRLLKKKRSVAYKKLLTLYSKREHGENVSEEAIHFAEIEHKRHSDNLKEYSIKKYKHQRDKARDTGSNENELDDFIVVFDPETGKNNVYFGGIDVADGFGHAHAVIDDDGVLHYLRDVEFGDANDKKGAVLKDDGINL